MSQFKKLISSKQNKRLTKKRKITQSLNKKNDEEYYQYQHEDDNKTDNIILDRVNGDCLAEIFTYLSPLERLKLALVCKKWKQVFDYYCTKVKKLELTRWNYDMHPSYLEKYPTYNDGSHQDPLFRFCKSLLHNYGPYLTELDLTTYDHCNILPVISEYCQNLVKLGLRFRGTECLVDSNTFAHLSKLKVLKIILDQFNHDNVPILLTALLRNVAETLTELNLSYWIDGILNKCDIPHFYLLLTELTDLKKLDIFGFKIDRDLVEYLEKSQISYDDDVFPFHQSRYMETKSLKLIESPVTNDLLYNIANCSYYLRELKISCEHVTEPGILAISKMQNLLHLNFKGQCDVTSSSFELLKNFTRLSLPDRNKITDYSLIKILENSPKIKKFRIKKSAISFEFIKKVAEITNNRRIKLKLGLESSIPSGIERYKSPYLKIYCNL